jgi:hypothetical protein
MKKTLLAIPFALLLTACGTPSVDDLIEDPELLRKIMRECGLLMMQGEDYDTEECKNAKLAQKKMMNNLLGNFRQKL